MRNFPERDNQPEQDDDASDGTPALPLTEAEARTLRDAVERIIGPIKDRPPSAARSDSEEPPQ